MEARIAQHTADIRDLQEQLGQARWGAMPPSDWHHHAPYPTPHESRCGMPCARYPTLTPSLPNLACARLFPGPRGAW